MGRGTAPWEKQVKQVVALPVLLAAALLLALPATAAPTPSRPLAVKAAFAPSAVEFGDTVTARIVVTMNAQTVQPSSLKVVYGVAPLTQLGSAVARHATRGGLSVTTYEVRAACLTDACVAGSGRRAIAPHRVRAEVATRAGGRVSVAAAWTPLVVSGRVAQSDLAQQQPPFRADTTPPPASYRIRPATLAALLDVLAAVLVACALGLAALALLRARRPRHAAPQDELTRALQLARAARTRPEPDRRSAAGYVARLLSRRDDPLTQTAEELAWSRPAPAPDSLTELVDGVERERRP